MPFLRPEGAPPERFLIYGAPKAGKSNIWVQIARMYKRTNTDAKVWVLDNDRTGRRTVGARSENADLADHVEIVELSDPEEYAPKTREVLAEVMPDDFIVADMASNLWDILPDWWMQNVYGEEGTSYWVQVRREILAAEEQKKGHEKQFGGTSGVDWQFIKKVYKPWDLMLTYTAPCNVIMICGETEIQAHHDPSGALRAQYSSASGFMPTGEKKLSHRVDTVLRMSKTVGKDGKKILSRELTMVGDRDREHLWEEITGRTLTIELSKLGFPHDYLKRFAGWEIVK